MTAIEDHARARGAPDDRRGLGREPRRPAFHARLGYRHIATVPEAGFKFGRYMDLVLMQKFL
jgi:L-amino acid N-acyltransferase